MDVMANVGALHPENDVLRYVGGVVGNAFEVAGYEQGVQGLADDVGPLVHGLDQLDESVVAHAIDDVIHFEHSLRELDLALNERFQSAPHHGAHRGSHPADVDGQISRRQFYHVHHALGDVDRLIAHAFQIRIDLCNRQNESQIDGHRLLHGEQIKRFLVDLALGNIDEVLAFEHHLAASEIAFHVGLTRAVDRLLRQASHTKQPLPQIIKPLLKTRAHSKRPFLPGSYYPNLPVM